METRRLGESDLFITPIGLGSWALGGGNNPYGWGSQDDKESIETIRCAIDLGINWIDTAKGYGHGHSEEIVGKAVSGLRDKVIIATKCGILWKEDGSDIYGHLKKESIRQEVESSLKRLGTDYIDLYQIHWPLPDEDIEEGWEAIFGLIQEGKVRFGGVSNFSVEQLKRILDIHRVTSLQPPYSMIKRDTEKELLPFCKTNNIGVIVYSPMQSGLLTGKFSASPAAEFPEDDWRKNNPDFQEPLFGIHMELIEKLKPIAARHNQPLGNLAVNWVLGNEYVTGAIVGARRPSHIQETIKTLELKLNEDDIAEIDSLLTEHAKRIQESE